MNTFKIDLHKLTKDLKEVNKDFMKTDTICQITGVSRPTFMMWEKEAPREVELIYWNTLAFNHSFFEMIDKQAHLFPAFKLLKYYHEITGKPIETVIIKEDGKRA